MQQEITNCTNKNRTLWKTVCPQIRENGEIPWMTPTTKVTQKETENPTRDSSGEKTQWSYTSQGNIRSKLCLERTKLEDFHFLTCYNNQDGVLLA